MPRVLRWIPSLLFSACHGVASEVAAPSPKDSPKVAEGSVKADADRPQAPRSDGVVALHAWMFEVQRTEQFKTSLNGREIWFKGRMPAHTKVQARIEPLRAVDALLGPPSLLRVFVPLLHRELDVEGPLRTLRFDPTLLDERSAGRRVRVLRSDGAPEERQALLDLLDPWYELEWRTGAWLRVEQKAHGEAWPLADALALHRELALLLPPLPSAGLAKGALLRQEVVLPYPVPLHPPLTCVVEYRVEALVRHGEELVAEMSFQGEAQTRPSRGLEWGGIGIQGGLAKVMLSGSLKAGLAQRRLYQSKLKLETRLSSTSAAEAFESKWKLESSWREAGGK